MSEPFIVQGEPFDSQGEPFHSQGELKFRPPEEGRPKRAGLKAGATWRKEEKCGRSAEPSGVQKNGPREAAGTKAGVTQEGTIYRAPTIGTGDFECEEWGWPPFLRQDKH